MTQFGEPNVSDDLVRNDIFTPITAVVQQVLNNYFIIIPLKGLLMHF